MDLSPADLRLIEEEEANLKYLQETFQKSHVQDQRSLLLQQIFDLRNQLDGCNEDDVPQLTENINRLSALVNQQEAAHRDQLDPFNPYFARMQLKERNMVRDLYIGTHIYRSPGGRVQIVDWKTSPIAQLYFRYDEGEEYEEEMGSQSIEGEMILKRLLKVEQGELVQIQMGEELLYKEPKKGWQRLKENHQRLHGGAGTASRPERATRGDLGIGLSGNHSTYKHLPEITSLIDPAQFELITQPESGVIAIQGSAGSGKTTVALHRVAWLHHKDPERFPASKMMVMVFNKALSNYISKVLPSLGVDGVAIHYYESWAGEIRKALFGSQLPKHYHEGTPLAVIRFKKHPVLARRIDWFLQHKEEEIRSQLQPLIEGHLNWENYRHQPWLVGLQKFHKDLEKNQTLPLDLKSKALSTLERFLDLSQNAKELTLNLWDEFFSDFEGLRVFFAKQEEDPMPAGQLQEAISWIKDQYILRHNFWDREPGQEKDDQAQEATLDYEDDPILIYFYQKLFGEIKIQGQRLNYAHLLVDEAQDLSPLEMKVLFHFAQNPLSVTLAGDVNQQMIQFNGFKDWQHMFHQLGLQGQKISNLKVSYRSTFEIMDFAMQVLGEMAEGRNFIATRQGPPVKIFNFQHQGEMANLMAQTLKRVMHKEPQASVALIAANPAAALSYYRLLEPMEIPKLRLVEDQDFSFTAGVDITDIHQIKGLEFDYVILLDVDAVNYPNNSYHRFLLHVGATRAAHQLWIMNYRVDSELLPKP